MDIKLELFGAQKHHEDTNARAMCSHTSCIEMGNTIGYMNLQLKGKTLTLRAKSCLVSCLPDEVAQTNHHSLAASDA